MKKYRIVALGDSITYGYPFGHKYSWVDLVSQKLGLHIENSGINGNSLRDIFNRLTSDVIDVNPQFVILMGGTNDVCQGLEMDRLQQNFLKIIQTLQEYKIQPIVALPPPVEEKKCEAVLDEFRTFIKKQAKKSKVGLIDFYTSFLDPKKKTKRPIAGLLEDGIHPSAAGYRVMAEAAYPVLAKILK